jgi:predicted permease
MRSASDQGRGVVPGLALLLVRVWMLAYPRAFRAVWGKEMQATFVEAWAAARGRGVAAVMALLWRTGWNVTVEGWRQRWDERRARAGEARAQEQRGAQVRRSGGSMSRVAEDLRFGIRFLRRNPAFTVVVLLTLALGIGMNTAVYSVLYAVLYAPLPYAQSEGLVRVGRTHPSIPGAILPLSPANWLDLRTRVASIAPIEAELTQGFVLTDRGDAVRVQGGLLSVGFFDLLGVPAAQGRTFAAGDGEPGAAGVVVLSDGFWRGQMGGDAGIVGKTIRLDDKPHTVIGVMPPGFTLSQASLWVALRLSDPAPWCGGATCPAQKDVRGSNYLRLYSRLGPGVEARRAAVELEAAWRPLRDAFPGGNEGTGFTAATLREILVRSTRTPLLILAGAALFVLLIACANVANLMMVRAERRQREVGVRAALGAGRGRLARQFLTESVLISGLGGVIGVFVAWAGVRALVATFTTAVPRYTTVGINLPVLGFTLLAALATGILVGLVPAWRGRPDFSTLREGSRGGTARFTRTGRALVVAEVALAIMLVTSAGLLLKSYARAVHSDLGFDADGLVTASFWFPPAKYGDGDQRRVFFEQLTQRLDGHPDVRGVALSSMVPIREFGNNYTEIGVVGRDTKASFVENRYVTPPFFAMMQIRLLQGRNFTDEEARSGSGASVLINRTLAHQLFGDADPLGWKLTINAQPEIIGVVDDVRDFGPDQTPRPTMYFASTSVSNLLVRTRADAAGVTALLRDVTRQLDPGVALLSVQSMSEILDTALAGRRFQLTLIGVFAATALVLACVGIYGVLSYSVERQTREIGVRMALGARAAQVAGQVAWRGGRLAVLGVAFGVGGALALRSAIASQLFDVRSFDPLVYFGVCGLLLLVAAVACLIPARRAATIHPVRALNTE